MKYLTKITILFAVFVISINAQNPPTFVNDSLNNYVENALELWRIPGAALLIVKDGKIVHSKGYGVKEIGKVDKVDENTLFMIGSNTKAFTGTALALLENEGQCKLNDKVIEYLPNFKMKDPWVTKELTLTDIVTHRMGLETFQGDFMYWDSDLTEDEVIEKFGKLTPIYDFRAKYGYTNAGYTIAGKIIQKISGLSWADYLKEKIFIPLEMDHTIALSKDLETAVNFAKPHTIVDGELIVMALPNIDNLAPCGSISSSVSDMSHWIIAQLDSGRYNEESVIPYKVIQRTRKPETIQGRVRHPFNEGHFNLYGLGWGLMDYEGTEIVSHTGGVNGFVTSVTLIPEENLGIVVLTNTDQNGFFQALKWEIIDAYLNLPYRNYSQFYFNFFNNMMNERNNTVAAWRDSVKMNLTPEVSLTEFVGVYNNEVYGKTKIEAKADYLELTFEHHSGLVGKLEYIGNNRFLCTYSEPIYGIKVLPFEIKNERVESFQLYVDDFVEFTSYTFKKN